MAIFSNVQNFGVILSFQLPFLFIHPEKKDVDTKKDIQKYMVFLFMMSVVLLLLCIIFIQGNQGEKIGRSDEQIERASVLRKLRRSQIKKRPMNLTQNQASNRLTLAETSKPFDDKTMDRTEQFTTKTKKTKLPDRTELAQGGKVSFKDQMSACLADKCYICLTLTYLIVVILVLALCANITGILPAWGFDEVNEP